jgi:hypothetical protein
MRDNGDLKQGSRKWLDIGGEKKNQGINADSKVLCIGDYMGDNAAETPKIKK